MLRGPVGWTANCGCQCEYFWDDANLNADPVGSKTVSVCADHQALGIANPQDHHDSLLGESRAREYVKGRLLATFPAAQQAITNPDGSTTIGWKAGFEPTVTFNPVRVGKGRSVNIITNGLSAAQKAALQTWADGRFQPGKVTIL